MLKHYFVILTSALLIFIVSCASLKAVIIDASSIQTHVLDLKLKDSKRKILILEGSAQRTIPLKNIFWIRISPRETRNVNGKTYYLAEMELKDGTKILTYKLKDGSMSQAFVCVNDTLYAKTSNGPLVLDFSLVNKITFEDQ